MIDEYGDYLVADLSQFHSIVLDDVWAGKVPVRHVVILADQLKLNPYSRVRAAHLGDMRWIGFDETAFAAAAARDAVAAIGIGLSGRTAPAGWEYPRPVQPERDEPAGELVAETIAEFSVAGFMRHIYD